MLENVEKVCRMDKQKLNELYHNELVDKVKYNQDLFLNFDRKIIHRFFSITSHGQVNKCL